MKLYPAKELETPYVVGKNLQEACSILARHELNARLIEIVEDPLLAEGTVVSQTPRPGQKIKQNQAVFIIASTIPQKVSCPDCVKKKYDDIQKELSTKNIQSKVFYIPNSLYQDVCLSQWPEAGLPLERNKIMLYMAKEDAKPIMIPYLEGKPALPVIEYLQSQSIEVDISHIEPLNNPEHECTNCIIQNQRPLGGSLIPLSNTKQLRMQLNLSPYNP
jgi:beta-lactam-binding protein with PASTA domain